MVTTTVKLQMKLNESLFPFSKRMLNFFELIEIRTVEELAGIPISKFTCFRGFKAKSKEELIAFIVFEGIEDLFIGFDAWKQQ